MGATMKRLTTILAGVALALALLIPAGCVRDSASDGGLIYTTKKNAVITVATSTTLSAEVDIGDYAVVGFVVPAALTSTSIGWQCSATSGGTFVDMYDNSNTIIAQTVAVSRAYDLGSAAVGGCRYIKLKGGSAEAADRTIPLILGR